MTKKVKEKGKFVDKTEYVRNCEIRDKFIKQHSGVNGKDVKKGEKAFFAMGEKSEYWKQLRDIPIPPEYEWIFKHFMQIWQGCEYDFSGNVIFTFRTINEYMECYKVPLTVEDKKCLFKMKAWAMNTIAQLRDKE